MERKAVARPDLGPEQDYARIQRQEELGDTDAVPRVPPPSVECGGGDEDAERSDAVLAPCAPADDASGTVRADVGPRVAERTAHEAADAHGAECRLIGIDHPELGAVLGNAFVAPTQPPEQCRDAHHDPKH